MVKQLDLKFLKTNINYLDIEKINNIFFKIIEELEIFLDIDSTQKNVKFELTESIPSDKNKLILNPGVIRTYFDNQLKITISKKFQEFLPIILLREAYLTFLPFSLSNNDAVKIFINQIVELNLQGMNIIDEWREKTTKKLINYEYLSSHYDRLKEFFDLKIRQEEIDTAIEFFFQYIRNNLSIFEKSQKDIYDIIFRNFAYKTSISIHNDEIIETIRILIDIFYKKKTYRALVDYKSYFLELKNLGKIKTELSQRDFIKNLRWIKNFTYIGPSYYVNWRLTGIEVFFIIFTFNPILSKQQINSYIANLPFFYQSSSSENDFSIKIFGWFVIPKLYQNDLMNFLKKMKNLGYLSDILFIHENEIHNSLNLNYFREKFTKKKRIIDITHRDYDQKYEIFFKLEYQKAEQKPVFSILDFIILDRVRYYSVTGFSFEQINKALKALKSDLFNELVNQKKILKDFRKVINEIRETKTNIDQFINFTENNKKFGFFFLLKLLNDLMESIDIILESIHKNDIEDIYDLENFLKNIKLSKLINKDQKVMREIIKKILFQEIFPLYFKDRKQFFMRKLKYEKFRDYFSSCENLKIYNMDAIIKIIQDKNLINRIFLTKENKLEKIYQKNIISDLSKDDLQEKLNSFIFSEPPLIKPLLISTLSVGVFANYFLQIIIKKTEETLKIYNNFKRRFPRVLYYGGNDIINKTEIFSVQIWTHNITSHEKFSFISLLYNLFEDNLLSLRRYFFDGFFKPYSRRDFYDFEKNEFFYTQDLYKEYFKYSKAIFGKKLKKLDYVENKKESLFWIKEKKDMNLLVEEITDRVSREKIEFSIKEFEELKNFHQSLTSTLLNNEKFNDKKQEVFFQKYIDHIYFIPNYQKFGYSYYYLYINPSNLNEIDFKLLLINTFDEVKYPGYIDKSKSLFISYLFPYRNPNNSYLNWLTKSKKIINEYCLFYIKKVHQLFHFDYNISPKGWDLNPNRFKSFYQNLLFNPEYKIKTSMIKEYELGNLKTGDKFTPDSKEFKILKNLYSFQKTDLKTILALRDKTEIENIEYLVKKELIFPFIDLKNFGLIEELTIILPNIEKEIIPQLIKIFSFFNFGFLYEIEGSYFFTGLREDIFYENGLLIILLLPDCNIGEFVPHFDKIFQYLDIEKYLILNDLLDGTPFLENLYGDLSFRDEYNSFQNLEWNKTDQIWMNQKLFDEEFNFLYPELIEKKSSESKNN